MYSQGVACSCPAGREFGQFQMQDMALNSADDHPDAGTPGHAVSTERRSGWPLGRSVCECGWKSGWSAAKWRPPTKPPAPAKDFAMPPADWRKVRRERVEPKTPQVLTQADIDRAVAQHRAEKASAQQTLDF